MDTPRLWIEGPVDDLRRWMTFYGTFSIQITTDMDDLGFLVPCADLITELRFWNFVQIGDASAMAALTAVNLIEHSPPSADAVLPSLPMLRNLVLFGQHDLAPLRECHALRELTLDRTRLKDLQALPALPLMERLVLKYRAVRSLAGLERQVGLRSLGLTQVMPTDETGTDVLTRRFGFNDVHRLVAYTPSHARKIGQLDIELQVDRARALDAGRASTYAAEVTPTCPACVVLLVDRSASAEMRFCIDFRVIADPNAPPHHIDEHFGQGPDGDVPIGQAITDAVNSFLRSLAARCVVDDEIRHDVHVGLIEYGTRVGSAWSGALAGRDLVPIADIARHPLREDAGGATWLEFEHDGATPMGEAFERAHDLVAKWADAHPDSFPPIVINLTAGKPTGDDLSRHAWAIRSISTRDGSTLLCTVERNTDWACPFWAAGERSLKYLLASPLPPPFKDAAVQSGYPIPDGMRSFLRDACAADFVNALHIFTAIPGLPRDAAAISHPLPPEPYDPDDLREALEPLGDGLPVPYEWKPSRLRGPMTEQLFWKAIAASRRDLLDPEEQSERLVRVLRQLKEEDIVEFDRLLQARINDAYSWDLWAVAFIAQGGCSDDGFEYFCCWLIAQGQAYFEAALKSPAAAARRIQPGESAELEPLLYVALEAWRERTERDEDDETFAPVERVEPRGEPWEEEDLPRLFPKLVKRFASA